LHRLNRARDRAEFVAAIGDIVAPQINVTYADADGGIGFYAPGRVPIRKRGDGFYVRSGWDADEDWNGYVPFAELPHIFDPSNGTIVNANNRIAGDGYPYFISRDWDAPYRAQRILTMLDEKRGKYEMQDAVRMQADNISLVAKTLLPLMTTFEPQSPAGRRVMSRLRTWNGHMSRDTEEPLIFMAWLRRFSRAVYEDELGDNISSFWSLRPLFIQNILSSDAGNYWCDDKRTPVVETCRGLLESTLMMALHELALRSGTDDANEWRWGDEHRARFNHPLFNTMPVLGAIANLWIETDGGEYTVNRGGMRISDDLQPFSHVHGAGFRGVYNLADLDRSRFVIATGQSGNILSPYYRNLMWLWRDGGFVVLNKSREALAREARLRITLIPR
jgi:penicillin amidase